MENNPLLFAVRNKRLVMIDLLLLHNIQCPRIKEQRELYKEMKKEEIEGQIDAIGELQLGG